MRNRFLKRSAFVTAVIALVLIIAHISMAVTIAAVVLFVVCAALWIVIDRKETAEEKARLISEKEQEIMRALSHYRHDWMNDLQVLFGYVSLKKYDKLAAYLEKIKSKLGEESHIAASGNASLSLLLMSYRFYSQNYDLHVTLNKSVQLNAIPLRPDRLVRIVKSGLDLFQKFALLPGSSEDPNELDLTIVTTDDHVELVYQFTGEFGTGLESELARWMAELSGEGATGSYVVGEDQADVTVRIRYE